MCTVKQQKTMEPIQDVQHYSNAYDMNSTDQVQYTELSTQLKSLALQINVSDNTCNVLQDIDNINEQLQHLVHTRTHISSIDTFKPRNVQSQQCHLLQLDDNILVNILQYLPIVQLIEMRIVCVQLRQLIFDSRIWRYGLTITEDVLPWKHHWTIWYLRIYQPTTFNTYNCKSVTDITSYYMYALWRGERRGIWKQSAVTQLVHDRCSQITSLRLHDSYNGNTSLYRLMQNVETLTVDIWPDVRELGIITDFKNIKQLNLTFCVGFANIISFDTSSCELLKSLHHIPCINITIRINKSITKITIDDVQSIVDTLLQQPNVCITGIVQDTNMDYSSVRLQRIAIG